MTRRRRVLSLFAMLLLGASALPGSAAAASAATRPIPQISRVLLVSVDGLRPDLVLQANAPVMQSMLGRGSHTLWARTTALAVTLPSHVSMLTGVPPGKHGIEWNSALPLTHPIYPAWPTIFEIARKAGYTTAMAAGKSKFSALAKPGSLSWSFVPDSSITPDSIVTGIAVGWIQRNGPQVLFVHLPDVDGAGHEFGWGSPEQLAAIGMADRCIGRLVDAIRARGWQDSTFVLVTADHGGAGKTHGPDDPRSRMIPWIATGPGVCRGVDLTTDADLTVNTEDTFATLCYVLGITPPRPVDGQPVTRIFCDAKERAVQR